MASSRRHILEKLAASRFKKVMSRLFASGDRSRYDQLLEQARRSLNKGGARIPENADFTQLYRRMQEAPEVSEKSLRLKDRLTGSALRRTASSPDDTGKRPYELKRGISVTTDNLGGNIFGTRFTQKSDVDNYLNNPRSKPIGHISATDPSTLPSTVPGRARAIAEHEFYEGIDSLPFIIKELGLQSPKASNLYPKGQGNNNNMLWNILGHNSANPLLAERLHTRGRTLIDRFKPGIPLPYRIGSRAAEDALRNAGNVGGFTPAPGGKAAGSATRGLNEQLGDLRGLAREQLKRLKYTVDGQTMGRKGKMLGDTGYTRDY